MFWQIVLLIVGMALLVKGADFFVEGSSNIAKALKPYISPAPRKNGRRSALIQVITISKTPP